MTYKLGTGHWRPESSPGNAVWDDVTITGDYDAVTALPHDLDVAVFVPQDGSGGTVDEFEAISGADVSYVLEFHSLSAAVPVSSMNAINLAGRTPVIGLEPWDEVRGEQSSRRGLYQRSSPDTTTAISSVGLSR